MGNVANRMTLRHSRMDIYTDTVKHWKDHSGETTGNCGSGVL